MAIEAQIERGGAERRGTDRKTVRLLAPGTFPTGEAAEVRIENLSSTGLLLNCAEELAVDDRLEIELPLAGTRRAKVVWASGPFYGCQFDREISNASLSAALLQSDPDSGEDGLKAATRRPAADAWLGPTGDSDDFGARLAFLRKQRGLSMLELAEKVGVTKPAVWKWETGHSRPRKATLAAIAESLEVEEAALLYGGGGAGMPVDEVVASAKQRIAEAFGTAADKVTIRIEL